MCYSVLWKAVEGGLCLLEVLEFTEMMRCVLGTGDAGDCGGFALFRGLEISLVAVFSLWSTTNSILSSNHSLSTDSYQKLLFISSAIYVRFFGFICFDPPLAH